MKQEKEYHIDVTDQEDMLFREPIEWNKTKEKGKVMNIKVIGVVVGIHLAGAAALMAFSPGDKKGVGSNGVASQEPVVVSQGEDKPVTVSQGEDRSVVISQGEDKKVDIKPGPITMPKKGITTSYTVKKGDTFTGIVKRFKLNPKKLIELNHLKDSNKLYVGQKLKFI